MKRPAARPLYSILFLTIFAITVTCRILLRRGLGLGVGSSPLDVDSEPYIQYQVTVFNSTLLKFAEIDAGELKLKKEIEQLLEGNFASHARYRTFATWRRYNRYDASSRALTRGFPATLRSPLFYRYWLDVRKNLNDWDRIRRFQDDIMLDLVRLVKHPLDKHYGDVASNRKYASCAVVGNSGILLKNEHGELIDSHEMVIRLNNAGIGSFEQNVGSKTTVSFVNSNILHLCARKDGCFCHPYGGDVPIIMYICQPVHFLDYTICNSSHKAPLLITDPRFDILCAWIAKYYSLKRFAAETGKSLEDWSGAHDGANFHYSSGMQAIMLALGVCDKVSVFGFGKSETAKHHYHTNQKGELQLHDYPAEYDLYDDLVHRPWAVPFVSKKFKFPSVVMYK